MGTGCSKAAKQTQVEPSERSSYDLKTSRDSINYRVNKEYFSYAKVRAKRRSSIVDFDDAEAETKNLSNQAIKREKPITPIIKVEPEKISTNTTNPINNEDKPKINTIGAASPWKKRSFKSVVNDVRLKQGLSEIGTSPNVSWKSLNMENLYQLKNSVDFNKSQNQRNLSNASSDDSWGLKSSLNPFTEILPFR